MPNPEISDIPVEPGFDLEDFMNFSQESRLSSETLRAIVDQWEAWLPLLNAKSCQGNAGGWLAVWLPESVEQKIDAVWQNSPSEGYLLNTLAQYLCMAAVYELAPQTGDLGCAPTPKPDPELAAALASLGLAGKAGLNRRYAILTPYPFRGGCEICDLGETCPRIKAPEFNGFTLPGYEPE